MKLAGFSGSSAALPLHTSSFTPHAPRGDSVPALARQLRNYAGPRGAALRRGRHRQAARVAAPAGDDLELVVVLKSFPGEAHLPELDGEGLEVHVTIEADQFCIRGMQIPVLSNLPRRFTFGGYEESTGAGRRIVVYVSTTAEVTCETSFDGTATPIQWDAGEDMSDAVQYIIDVADETDCVRAELSEG